MEYESGWWDRNVAVKCELCWGNAELLFLGSYDSFGIEFQRVSSDFSFWKWTVEFADDSKY